MYLFEWWNESKRLFSWCVIYLRDIYVSVYLNKSIHRTWLFFLVIRSPQSLRWSITMGCRPSSVNIFFLNFTKLVCSICRFRRQEFLIFMTPYLKGRSFWSQKVKNWYISFKNLLFSEAWFTQTKDIEVKTKEGST